MNPEFINSIVKKGISRLSRISLCIEYLAVKDAREEAKLTSSKNGSIDRAHYERLHNKLSTRLDYLMHKLSEEDDQ